MQTRIERVQAAMRAKGVSAVAIMPGANLRYLTGMNFGITKRLTIAFVPVEGEMWFVLPAMEAARADQERQVPLRFFTYRHDETTDAVMESVTREIQALAISHRFAEPQVAVEYYALRMFEARAIEKASSAIRLVDAGPILTPLRAVKDAHELTAMREAVRMIETALSATIAQIRPGITEREIGNIWLQELMATGSEGPSFPLTVASGPNGALPHHENGNRAVQSGDLIVLDGGALHQGYASDITRTVALGVPAIEAREVYELVKRANAAGRAYAHAGASGHNIDAAARAVIEAGGYGPQFLHRTGHGLGLEIHEPPFIAVGENEPLPAGATFTIEPGVYLNGRFGVRIEDMVTVSEHGAETLTTLDRELILLPD